MAVNGMNLSEMIEAAKTSGNEEIVFMLLDKIGQAEPQAPLSFVESPKCNSYF